MAKKRQLFVLFATAIFDMKIFENFELKWTMGKTGLSTASDRRAR